MTVGRRFEGGRPDPSRTYTASMAAITVVWQTLSVNEARYQTVHSSELTRLGSETFLSTRATTDPGQRSECLLRSYAGKASRTKRSEVAQSLGDVFSKSRTGFVFMACHCQEVRSRRRAVRDFACLTQCGLASWKIPKLRK